MSKKWLIIIIVSFLVIPSLTFGQEETFFVDPKFDISSRATITAHLFKKTNKINFYIDGEWLKNYSYDSNKLNDLLYQVANNFEYNTFPTLTKIYGAPSNWQNPSWHLSVVFHSLKKDYGGYTRSEDLYSKSFSSTSNNQDIIFLNTSSFQVPPSRLASYLAHEFTHLLSLNLKFKNYHLQDDTWLEELRAELSETMTQKVDNNFSESILKQRLSDFIFINNFSLLDWHNTDYDYAIVNVLGQYLREKYGENILRDSLNSSFKGTESIDYALKKNGYNITFEEILQNWMIATVLNDCSINELYCFRSPFLNKLQKEGDVYFIPTKVESQMMGTDYLKGSSGKWLKFAGGMTAMNIKFTLVDNVPIYRIPYIILKTDGSKQLGFLDFTSLANNNLIIDNKNNSIQAIIFLLSLNDDTDYTYSYTFEIKSFENNPQQEQQIIQQLEARIAELKRRVAVLQLQLSLLQTNKENVTCSNFSSDLYYGMTSPEVKCLQQFLANLGDDIYPEKLVTGYYGPLTLAAVKRYQTLKGIITTGYFGPLTRAQANQEM